MRRAHQNVTIVHGPAGCWRDMGFFSKLMGEMGISNVDIIMAHPDYHDIKVEPIPTRDKIMSHYGNDIRKFQAAGARCTSRVVNLHETNWRFRDIDFLLLDNFILDYLPASYDGASFFTDFIINHSDNQGFKAIAICPDLNEEHYATLIRYENPRVIDYVTSNKPVMTGIMANIRVNFTPFIKVQNVPTVDVTKAMFVKEVYGMEDYRKHIAIINGPPRCWEDRRFLTTMLADTINISHTSLHVNIYTPHPEFYQQHTNRPSRWSYDCYDEFINTSEFELGGEAYRMIQYTSKGLPKRITDTHAQSYFSPVIDISIIDYLPSINEDVEKLLKAIAKPSFHRDDVRHIYIISPGDSPDYSDKMTDLLGKLVDKVVTYRSDCDLRIDSEVKIHAAIYPLVSPHRKSAPPTRLEEIEASERDLGHLAPKVRGADECD